MRIIGIISSAIILLIVSIALADSPQRQQPEVFAEPINSANLRSGPGTEFEVIGEISAGTEYRVLRQHSLYPWLLLEVPSLPNGAGWVFNTLVTIRRGDLATVPFEEAVEALSGAVPQVLTSEENLGDDPITPTPTLAAPASVVTATLTGRSNIRYGPGVEYPTIATLDEGAVMTVIARHSQYPWYRVAVETSPDGTGWVLEGVVEIEGDVFSLPLISDVVFEFPTPSATPNTVVVSDSPLGEFGSDDSRLASELGEPIHNYLLAQGLAPHTDQEGSVFVLDLFTGEHFSLNAGVAYSGMSITKIPVLLSYFLGRDRPLEVDDAELVANTMICSENITTNQMMTIIGDGDILAGGQRITQNMQRLGLGNSFLVAPYDTGNPNATPAPVSSVTTNVDQQRTQPDPFNQLTVEEMGWLLGSIYSCAADGTGPLIETFPDQINQTECRQMIRVMSANRIGSLIEAGVEPGAIVAHKHGWIDDTVGDVGLVFGPDGAYVLAMVAFNRTDWSFQLSPALEEVARQTWNYFNPTSQIDQTFSSDVPATCNIYGEPVIEDMLSGNISIPTVPAPAPTAIPQATGTPTQIPPTLEPAG
jgi:uncharacterized protein YgiM (DUF1202 family)